MRSIIKVWLMFDGTDSVSGFITEDQLHLTEGGELAGYRVD